MMDWWEDIQPDFWKGTGNRPPSVYDAETSTGTLTDIWAPLQKGEPNGLLCALTILLWWGQCAGMHSQWEDNMLPF
jgi:hypothetical protein